MICDSLHTRSAVRSSSITFLLNLFISPITECAKHQHSLVSACGRTGMPIETNENEQARSGLTCCATYLVPTKGRTARSRRSFGHFTKIRGLREMPATNQRELKGKDIKVLRKRLFPRRRIVPGARGSRFNVQLRLNFNRRCMGADKDQRWAK